MPDPNVHVLGEVDDIDGRVIKVGTDYDTVSIVLGGFQVRLTSEAAEGFAQLFVRACWRVAP